MRTCISIIALSLVLAMCMPALGQLDLLTGKDSRSELRFGLYTHVATGDQDLVRQYDGREFDLWGIELLNSYGYDGPHQYWITARDLITGNEDVRVSLDYRDSLTLNLNTTGLTHRLGRRPAINPYLANVVFDPGEGPSSPLSGINPLTNAPFGDAFTDLSPDTRFRIDRRVNDFNMRLHGEHLSLVTGWWQENESGAQQVLFTNSYPEFVVQGRQAAGLLINRTTSIGTLGADARLSDSSVVNYRYTHAEFVENAGTPLVEGTLISKVNMPDIKACAHLIKARTKLSDRLFLTGVHSQSSRRNVGSRVPTPVSVNDHHYVDEGSPLENEVKTRQTNVGLNFLASNALTLSAKYRDYDLGSRITPVFELDGNIPADTPSNMKLSRHVQSLETNASYTGIPRLYLSGGFEDRSVHRDRTPVHPPHEEFEHPFTSATTKNDIWRAGFRYYPGLRLSLQGSFEKWNIVHPGYAGVPGRREQLNLNATYLLSDSFAVYGDFNSWDEENAEIRLALDDIPTPATDQAGSEDRVAAAGQGYRNKFRTTSIGAWYGLSPKVTIDANYAKIKTDSAALWIIGVDFSYPPHLPPYTAPLTADSRLWSAGLTYSMNKRIRTYGRFTNADSQGHTLFGNIPGNVTLPEAWNPLDIREKSWTLGVAYDVSARARVLLDFLLLDWDDQIEPANDGRFEIWRFAWSSPF